MLEHQVKDKICSIRKILESQNQAVQKQRDDLRDYNTFLYTINTQLIQISRFELSNSRYLPLSINNEQSNSKYVLDKLKIRSCIRHQKNDNGEDNIKIKPINYKNLLSTIKLDSLRLVEDSNLGENLQLLQAPPKHIEDSIYIQPIFKPNTFDNKHIYNNEHFSNKSIINSDIHEFKENKIKIHNDIILLNVYRNIKEGINATDNNYDIEAQNMSSNKIKNLSMPHLADIEKKPHKQDNIKKRMEHIPKYNYSSKRNILIKCHDNHGFTQRIPVFTTNVSNRIKKNRNSFDKWNSEMKHTINTINTSITKLNIKTICTPKNNALHISPKDMLIVKNKIDISNKTRMTKLVNRSVKDTIKLKNGANNVLKGRIDNIFKTPVSDSTLFTSKTNYTQYKDCSFKH